MTAVAVTVTRTLERVSLLRDRAAATVIRYTMTAKTIEKVRAICRGKTARVTHPQIIIEPPLFAQPTVLRATAGILNLESIGGQQGNCQHSKLMEILSIDARFRRECLPFLSDSKWPVTHTKN